MVLSRAVSPFAKALSSARKHPLAFVFAGAALGGLNAANPVKEASGMAQQELFGSPTAFRSYGNAVAQAKFEQFYSPYYDRLKYQNMYSTRLNSSRSANPTSSLGVPGSMVFGMYNLRRGGN